MNEQRDIIRAIMALQQQQQDSKQEKESISSRRGRRNEPNSRNSSSSRSITLVSSGEETPTTLDQSNRQHENPGSIGKVRSLRKFCENPNVNSSVNPQRSRDSNPNPILSLAAFQTPNPSSLEEDRGISQPSSDQAFGTANIKDNDTTPQLSSSSQAPNPIDAEGSSRGIRPSSSDRTSSSGKTSTRTSQTAYEVEKAELQMFLLKPVVKDYFDKIELSWSVRNTKMQQSEIRKQMTKNERDNLPSVMDMLEDLHASEQATIEKIIADMESYAFGSAAELIALKRTKTHISHREMVFQDVPGLQFIVQQDRSQRQPGGHPLPVPIKGDQNMSSILFKKKKKGLRSRASPHRSMAEPEIFQMPLEQEELSVRSTAMVKQRPDPGQRSHSRDRRYSINVLGDIGDAPTSAQSNKKIAQAGLAGPAVAGLVERARSKSRRGGRSRSRSRFRRETPVASAGLGSAAIAALYENNQSGKKEERSRSTGRKPIRSRSRSQTPPSSQRYPVYDADFLEYAGQPIYSKGGESQSYYHYFRPASYREHYQNLDEAMTPSAAAAAAAGAIHIPEARRDREYRQSVSSEESGGRRRRRHRGGKNDSRSGSRSDDSALMMAASTPSLAAGGHEKRGQIIREERKRRRRSKRRRSNQTRVLTRLSKTFLGRGEAEKATYGEDHNDNKILAKHKDSSSQPAAPKSSYSADIGHRYDGDQPPGSKEVVLRRPLFAELCSESSQVGKREEAMNLEETPAGRISEGGSEDLFGQTLDGKGDIIAGDWNVIRRAEVVPGGAADKFNEHDKEARRPNLVLDCVNEFDEVPKEIIGECMPDPSEAQDPDPSGQAELEETGEQIKEFVPENARDILNEGPFAGLGALVVENGMVEDNDGNTVGLIVEGDATTMAGCKVDEDGKIVDIQGNVKGHAEPYEEPEEERVASDDERLIDEGTHYPISKNLPPRNPPRIPEARTVKRKAFKALNLATAEHRAEPKHHYAIPRRGSLIESGEGVELRIYPRTTKQPDKPAQSLKAKSKERLVTQDFMLEPGMTIAKWEFGSPLVRVIYYGGRTKVVDVSYCRSRDEITVNVLINLNIPATAHQDYCFWILDGLGKDPSNFHQLTDTDLLRICSQPYDKNERGRLILRNRHAGKPEEGELQKASSIAIEEQLAGESWLHISDEEFEKSRSERPDGRVEKFFSEVEDDRERDHKRLVGQTLASDRYSTPKWRRYRSLSQSSIVSSQLRPQPSEALPKIRNITPIIPYSDLRPLQGHDQIKRDSRDPISGQTRTDIEGSILGNLPHRNVIASDFNFYYSTISSDKRNMTSPGEGNTTYKKTRSTAGTSVSAGEQIAPLPPPGLQQWEELDMSGTPYLVNRNANTHKDLADNPVEVGIQPVLLASTSQMMTLETDKGPIQVPIDVQAASKVADEKRKRNATASHRFRQNRKEKERETMQKIADFEQQIRELEERDNKQIERETLSKMIALRTSLIQRHHRKRPKKVSSSYQANQAPQNLLPSNDRNTRLRMSIRDGYGPVGEEKEAVADEVDDAVVAELLEKYTTLFA